MKLFILRFVVVVSVAAMTAVHGFDARLSSLRHINGHRADLPAFVVNKAKGKIGNTLPVVIYQHATRAKGLNLSPASLGKAFSVMHSDRWFIWAMLSFASTAGIAAEKSRVGAMLSSPLVTMAITLILCNVGVLPAQSPIYDTVVKFLVPLAIPLLLLDADIRKCLKLAGRLLSAFLLGSIGTVVGTLAAFALVPMRATRQSPEIAAALCARHIGGAVNFIAVADILKISPDLVTAALAADNLIVALYFAFLFSITVPNLNEPLTGRTAKAQQPRDANTSTVLTADMIIMDIDNTSSNDGIETEAKSCPFSIVSDESDQRHSAPVPITMPVQIVDEASLPLSLPSPAPSTNGCPLNAIPGLILGDKPESPTSSALSVPLATTANARRLSMDLTGSGSGSGSTNPITLGSISAALTLSMALVCVAYQTSARLALPAAIVGGNSIIISPLLLVSLLAVTVATVFPATSGSMSNAGGTIGVLFMQMFFAVTGAMGHIPSVMKVAPALFSHSAVQIIVHFLFVTVSGRLLKIPFNEIALASNANVGGPTTAAGMASSKRWDGLVLPALLTGIFGYSIATILGVLVSKILLRM